MKKLFKVLLLIICVGALAFLYNSRLTQAKNEEREKKAAELLAATQVTEAPVEEATPTPPPTPEPTPELFVISCVGDNRLYANPNFVGSEYGLPKKVGDDYAYPYKNTKQYFENDELTIANLECTLSDKTLYSAEQFSFLAPTAYVNILTEGGVDFVTMANNHAMDFSSDGVNDTKEALDGAGIKYCAEGESQIVRTKNGLEIGIYSSGNDMRPDLNKSKALEAIAGFKEKDVDYIICMFHWGQELYYKPNDNQTSLAKDCIDAGANLVYGSHPHCLQPIEEYNGGIILYSMGNWVFGGNTMPSDPDTAIVQITLERDSDGNVTYKGFDAIPCAVSSNIDGANARVREEYAAYENYNDYCPTPYEEGSEGYERALSKLKGTYETDKQGADYSDYYASWG